MDYKVSGRGGKRRVEFACVACGASLASPLAEAGQGFDCPTCKQGVIVPGERELQEQLAAEDKSRADALAEEVRREAEQREADERRASQSQRLADEKAAAKERRAAAAAEERANVPPLRWRPISISITSGGVLTLLIVYALWVRPLQLQARASADAWATLAAALEVNGQADAAQRQTVELAHDEYAATASRLAASLRETTQALAALEKTMTENARLANTNFSEQSLRIIEAARLARNANQHAHSHNRY